MWLVVRNLKRVRQKFCGKILEYCAKQQVISNIFKWSRYKKEVVGNPVLESTSLLKFV